MRRWCVKTDKWVGKEQKKYDKSARRGERRVREVMKRKKRGKEIMANGKPNRQTATVLER